MRNQGTQSDLIHSFTSILSSLHFPCSIHSWGRPRDPELHA
ncbi:hypothetical protein [Neobacillus vireti]